MTLDQETICVVGLGYVGLPLAVAFGRQRKVIGFDTSASRVGELRSGQDRTREVSSEDLAAARHLSFSSNEADIKGCGVFIVAVPTPIDNANRPDLSLLLSAAATAGRALRPGGVVIFESTVYPGCTRDECVPVLERTSGLKHNRDFFTGYSPERVNPGDRERRLETIVKVTSGSTDEAALAIDRLYAAIIPAGTHRASSIEVAEAAKVIENTQRDLNIALMNELAIIFHRLGIDTLDVLAAAGTKWNFLPFRPGLVGGHCIGVDPFYLTHRAQQAGYHPEVILSGRRINDNMGRYVAERVARLMMQRGFPVVGSRVLVLGLTFKENCPDLRNSKVADVIAGLKEYHAHIDVSDPHADPDEARHEYGIELMRSAPGAGVYDAVILAVAHRDYAALGAAALRSYGKPGAVLYDVKGLFPKPESDGRL